MKKKNKAIISISLAVALIAAVACIIYNTAVSYRAFSPDRVFRASYNRFTGIITVRRIENSTEWRFSGVEKPEFIWSESGRFLVMNVDTQYGRTAEILDTVNSSSRYTPDRAVLGELHPETATTRNTGGTRCEITGWVDDTKVSMSFSWPADEQGKTITGNYIYNIETTDISSFVYAISDNAT